MYFMEKVNMIAFGLSIKRYTNKKSYIRHNDTGKVIICAEDFAEEADAPRILFAVETNSAKKSSASTMIFGQGCVRLNRKYSMQQM